MENFDFERAEREFGHVVSPGHRTMAAMYQDVIDEVSKTHNGMNPEEIRTELVRVARQLRWEGDEEVWRQLAGAISSGLKVQVWTDD